MRGQTIPHCDLLELQEMKTNPLRWGDHSSKREWLLAAGGAWAAGWALHSLLGLVSALITLMSDPVGWFQRIPKAGEAHLVSCLRTPQWPMHGGEVLFKRQKLLEMAPASDCHHSCW